MPRGKEKESKLDVIVTVDDDNASDLNAFAKKLSAAGLEVSEVLDFVGQVSGRISKKDEAKLRKLKGVSAVETSGEVKLPPSDEDVQ